MGGARGGRNGPAPWGLGPDGAAEPVPPTEALPEGAPELDALPLPERLAVLHQAQLQAVQAVAPALPAVAEAVRLLVEGWPRGGRLLLVGAGTSGRLAAAEAAECPPTFGTDPRRVLAVVAGGDAALRAAVEGAEDDAAAGAAAMDRLAAAPPDLVLGISASGGAPFVVAAVRRAAERGARTGAVTAVAGSPLARACGLAIVVPTGAECPAGSTRMRAGTAQKVVLNLLTTAAMVQLGHVYRNRLVDFLPSNAKLRGRAVRTVAHLAGVGPDVARQVLEACGWQLKPAILCAAAGLTPEQAAERLTAADADLRRARGESAPPASPADPPR